MSERIGMSLKTSAFVRRHDWVATVVRAGFIGCALWLASSACGAGPVQREWTVNGLARKALVSVPPAALTNPAPVVFAFHGHGGTMQRTASKFRFHEL